MANQFGNYNQHPGSGIKEIFFGRNALSRLILINLVVFLVLTVIRVIMYFMTGELQIHENKPISDIAMWLAVPASLPHLADKPWTVITYMFLHEGFLHIFFNMIMLYFAGRIFMEYLGGRKLAFVYLLGGVCGAFLYILAFNIFPAFIPIAGKSVALGASASVLAIMVALAAFIPDYALTFMFIGRIKLKYIAMIFILIDLLTIEQSNPGGHIAHLGGALSGFFYILVLKKGMDMSKIFNPVGRFFKNLFKPKPKLRTTYSKRPLTDDEYNEKKVERQKKIDTILDKIAKSGYESLSKEEKEMLFKASQNEL